MGAWVIPFLEASLLSGMWVISCQGYVRCHTVHKAMFVGNFILANLFRDVTKMVVCCG